MEHEYNGDMFMKREHAETRWNKWEGGRMFRNLYAEEARHNQTNITMSKMLEINPVTYSRKKKDGSFTVTEAKKLIEFLFLLVICFYGLINIIYVLGF